MQSTGQQILVGVDSTGGPTAAVDWAVLAAGARHATLRVLNGFSPDQPAFSFGMDTDDVAIRATREHMLARVAAHARNVDDSVTVETHQSDTYPAKMLVLASGTADLVVVGAQGDSHLGFSSVGQTALQVASHAQSPVVIVRHGLPDQHLYKVITVGVDLPGDAGDTLEAAFEEAERTDSALTVVHAWQPRGSADPHLRRSDWSDYAATCEQQIRAALQDRRRAHPDVEVTVEVVRGNPTRILAEHSKTSDLLVFGARGSGGFEGLKLGQVARDTITHAHCTLMIIR